MKPFGYTRAASIADALAAATGDDRVAYLAGGTNIFDYMKLGVFAPQTLIDLRGLPLDQIEELTGNTIRLGSLVANSDLANSSLVRRRLPALSQAVLSGASGQIRNMATTGGNLLQRTRCQYFRDTTMPCNKRSLGSGCAAVGGHHREHAILGASKSCIATHPSDLAVALSACDATINAVGLNGDRSIPISELYRRPGNRPDLDTTLEPGDIIRSVDIPYSNLSMNTVYRKIRDRSSYAFALVSAAVGVEIGHDSTIKDVRISLGGVAPGPWRAFLAEDILRGTSANRETFRSAMVAELAQATPLSDNAFKVGMISNLIISCLEDVTTRQPVDLRSNNGR